MSRSRSRTPLSRSASPRSFRERSLSRSRSRSRSLHRDRSPSRSRSRSPRDSRSRRSPRSSHRRSRSPRIFSRRPPPNVGPKTASTWHKREAPDPSRCLGVFNLSMYTTEKDLREMFSEFGEIEKIDLVYDHPTGRSRGFGFVYFERLDDASAARDKLNGIEIDGRKIRIDYSVTKRAHSPTPGNYMGGFVPSFRGGGGGGGYSRGSGGRGYGGGGGGYGRDDRYGGGSSSRYRGSPPRSSRRRSRSRSYDRY